MNRSPVVAVLPILVLPAWLAAAQPAGQPALSWPPAPEPARIAFVQAFSSAEQLGTAKGGLLRFLRDLLFGREVHEFSRPYGIAVSHTGDRVCIADPGGKAVHVLDVGRGSSRLLREAGGRALVSPVGAALDARGRLYVADSGRGEVLVLDPALRLVSILGAGQGLARPTGIAAAADRLYVVDTAADQVVTYSIDGTVPRELFRFGGRGDGPGRFNFPVDIAVSGTGLLFVTDTMNFRVQAFDGQGSYRGSFGGPGTTSGHFQRPKGIALDSDGNLYVVDALADTVQIFGPEGAFLLNFGGAGAGSGQFWLPSGMAIDGTDRVYVVDSQNRRVQVFQYIKRGTDDETR